MNTSYLIQSFKKCQSNYSADWIQLLSLFSNTQIGIGFVSLENTFSKVNPAICDILQRTPEELIGKTWQSVTHPDFIVQDQKLIEKLHNGEIKSYIIPKIYLSPDNKNIPAILEVSPVPDASDIEFYCVKIMPISCVFASVEKLKKYM